MKLIKYVYKGLKCVIMAYIEEIKFYVEENYYSFFSNVLFGIIIFLLILFAFYTRP